MSESPTLSPALRTAAIAHALAHPLRAEIMMMLCDASLTVSEITEKLERPQANISQHLAVLREVHLVEATRDGMNVSYCLASPQTKNLLNLLETLGKEIPAEDFTPRGRGGRHSRGRGKGRGRRRQN